MSWDFNIREALDLESFLGDMPEATNQAAALALNEVIGGSGLAQFRTAIQKEVNFPQGYVDGDRFYHDQKATPTRLVTSLVGRQRPTSLARFATSGVVGGKGGVRVRVKKSGRESLFKSGFLVRLRAGSSLDGGNVGLAVRLKPGQVLNKRDTSRMVHLETNVVLLYGPSIDQILRNEVADQETPEVVEKISVEFFRQFARLAHG